MNLQLGFLEELVLIILLMKHETNGVEIVKEYETQFGQSITLPTIHVVLKRLEKKGLVRSFMGDPTPERGGRSKRLYRATNTGFEAAQYLHGKRNAMWQMITKSTI